jgi:hypothetical protein
MMETPPTRTPSSCTTGGTESEEQGSDHAPDDDPDEGPLSAQAQQDRRYRRKLQDSFGQLQVRGHDHIFRTNTVNSFVSLRQDSCCRPWATAQ